MADAEVALRARIRALEERLADSERVGTVLRNLTSESSILVGRAFFDAVSKHIAVALGVDIVFVGELLPGGDEVNVMGGYAHGAPIGALRYALAGTPCHNVMGRKFCLYASEVQAAFPDDHLLVEMGIHAYAGAPVFDKAGAAMGILVALHSGPFPRPLAVEDLFGAFVGTVAAEMERARVHSALLGSEARFRAIVEHIPGAVYECELRRPWRVTHMSQGVEPLTGRPTADFTTGRVSWAEMIAPEDLQAVEVAVDVGVSSGEPYAVEYRIVRSDGTLRWVHESGQCTYDGAGSPVCLRGVILDIGTRKDAEEQQDRLQVQLLQAQKLEAVGRLAGGIAHDFNNMLNVIIGHSELALDMLDGSSPARESIAEVQSAAVRAANLTRQLLAFARRQTVAPRAFDLNDGVGRLVGMLRRLIGEDISLAWTPWPTPLQVKLDPTQLDQALANLCVNARDAIEGVGHIAIATRPRMLTPEECLDRPGTVPGEYAELSVSDDGCGIPPEALDMVFEPFYTTKPVGKGTGLGLATVYGITKQNHGAVFVQSTLAKGTTFQILLPIDTGDAVQADASPADASRSPRGSEVVLVVEDEPAILDLAALVLERSGYRVLKAAGPREALALASDSTIPIDLVVTDVVMPHMTGRALAEALQRMRPHLRQLYVSGYPADVVAQQSILAEGVHFLQKPFTASALCARVREALNTDSPD